MKFEDSESDVVLQIILILSNTEINSNKFRIIDDNFRYRAVQFMEMFAVLLHC